MELWSVIASDTPIVDAVQITQKKQTVLGTETSTERAYWRDSLAHMKNRGNLSCFQLFVFLRLLCLSTKNKFTHYIFFYVAPWQLKVLYVVVVVVVAVKKPSPICISRMIFVLCLEFEYVYIYFGRRHSLRVFLSPFSFCFVFYVFSLFILSTLNKYHEKFQRSLTSN